MTALLVLHGLIHFAGWAKAYGLAALPELEGHISPLAGVLWFAAGTLTIVAAFLPLGLVWIFGPLALLLSQALIFSAWHDARYGTLANALLLALVVYGFAARGPLGLHAEYHADARLALDRSESGSILEERDLEGLPEPVQRYIRASGALGRPRPAALKARWRGRIRRTEDDPWMGFEAEQLNVFSPPSSRLFLMDATMGFLPTDVYHRFVGPDATFRVRAASIAQIVSARGAEMNRSETVTIFNDMCLLAPATLAGESVAWEPMDSNLAKATFTRLDESITAVLRIDDAGMLVDFQSDDRSRASADGSSFAQLPWSTPMDHPRSFGPLRLASRGEARWHDPESGAYAYVEMELLDLKYDPGSP